ncbi:MAG: 16S rRNA (adenine(1518)-N(6)/adenine(1519)-N(6))-dimethyltransferase RsmA [Chloroflexota bacterium]|nr:16S rRNA (adenine(1518)-N(6)/adenine(1519)-N(6))-dimethyltransferase RsmA [Chloroflexota bacterium]
MGYPRNIRAGHTPALAQDNGRPRKALGQHFLVDGSVAERILEGADLSPSDTVVEVGPGRGALTRALSERAGSVLALELDGALAAQLRQRLKGLANLRVVEADARTVELSTLLSEGVPYKVVANLPYYAASPILRRFLESERRPTVLVVMVQREVAVEMAAAPGRMGLLSVGIQTYARPRVLFTVPPTAFYPPPKVWSAVVRLDVLPAPLVSAGESDGFFALVRAGFSAPRKQLRNSLALGLGVPPAEAEALLAKAQVDPRRRAETLSLDEWRGLYRAHNA